MKLKALASLCNEAKIINLYNAPDGTQWAGTSGTIYKLPENLGQLTTDALCAIFDISAEKAAKMQISEKKLPTVYETDGYSTGEKDLLYWLDKRIIAEGTDALPLKAPGGEIICIPTKVLRPGNDAEQPGLCLRHTPSGAPYIVYKDGMFVQAIIMPRRMEPEMVTWLADVVAGLEVREDGAV